MINKRLINMVGKTKKYIFGGVILKFVSLVANVFLMYVITKILSETFKGNIAKDNIITTIIIAICVIIFRFLCNMAESHLSFLSSREVKRVVRKKIYEKLLRIGAGYSKHVNTSEVVQVTVEGVEQLETYFASYLPQFFYSLLAPISLFFVVAFISLPAAFILLICVPLIPIAIALVQKWAKKLLSKYWGQYTGLGDTFLENLQGLTTLKIYKSDKYKNDEMNVKSEEFRKITMKVLSMQLNSITIMDLIAYGGAALGIIMALNGYVKDNISLENCLFIILISADFFIPMRLMGSFFHIAMNGMAAADKIFRLLDIKEKLSRKNKEYPLKSGISLNNLSFGYDENKKILNNINVEFPYKSYTALVGESGCGKSTIAGLIVGKNVGYDGQILIDDIDLNDIDRDNIAKNITYIGHNSFLFQGTVAENLKMGKIDATDEELWNVLKQVNIAEFLKNENGLETMITQGAANLSGGQRQRIALARALLHNSSVYIFDEATSNIDIESEDIIMKQIQKLSKIKTVILISHRLSNVVKADNIYVLKDGKIENKGAHKDLLQNSAEYKKLWEMQQNLEKYTDANSNNTIEVGGAI